MYFTSSKYSNLQGAIETIHEDGSASLITKLDDVTG